MAKVAAVGSIGTAAIVALLLLAAHLLQPQDSPLFDTISLLALGRGGLLVTAALAMAGVALVAIAANLWMTMARKWLVRAGALGLALGGLQILLLAFFPTDPTVIPETAIGLAHWALSSIGLTVLPVSMVALSWQFGHETHGRLRIPARWTAVFGMVACIAYGVLSSLHGHSGLPGPFYDGLAERVLVLFILTWGILASAAVWRHAHVTLNTAAPALRA